MSLKTQQLFLIWNSTLKMRTHVGIKIIKKKKNNIKTKLSLFLNLT